MHPQALLLATLALAHVSKRNVSVCEESKPGRAKLCRDSSSVSTAALEEGGEEPVAEAPSLPSRERRPFALPVGRAGRARAAGSLRERGFACGVAQVAPA